jgi:hypothetical protein
MRSFPSPHAARVARAAMLALAMLAAVPAAARAQMPDTTGLGEDTSAVAVTGPRFEVSAVTGLQFFDESSALKRSPLLGIRIAAPPVRGLTLGVSGAFARPVTRGEYFPWNRQIYFSDAAHTRDTVLIFEVSQRVTLATYGVEAAYRLGAPTTIALPGSAPFHLELGAGIGGYTIWLDPEQRRRNEAFNGLQLAFGAGIGVPLGPTSVLRLRVDDIIMTNYDRDLLSLHDPLFFDDLFPNPVKAPPAAKSTIHNPRISVAFSFTPRPR